MCYMSELFAAIWKRRKQSLFRDKETTSSKFYSICVVSSQGYTKAN